MAGALLEVGIAGGATTAIATAVDASPLLTALIGFGTAVVTVVGGEVIKLLVAWLKKKRENIEGKNDTVNETDKNKEEQQ